MERTAVRVRHCPVYGRVLIVTAFLLVLSGSTNAQQLSPGQLESRLRAGINLYSQGKYLEAVPELRRAQAEAPLAELRGEALFWISLAELSAGEYEESLFDMDALKETDPSSRRLTELAYHRGRALYYLGRYDEAIVSLSGYIDSLSSAPGNNPASVNNPGGNAVTTANDNVKKAAALYWIGECLLSMGQLDKASDIFQSVVQDYPGSAKYEASVYRLALINQKKIEAGLLNLLKMSHEDSLRSMEEFRQKEIIYNQALSAYQKRISEILARSAADEEKSTLDFQESSTMYKEQLAEAENRISLLENTLKETTSSLERAQNSAAVEKLKSLKASAEELEALIGGTGK